MICTLWLMQTHARTHQHTHTHIVSLTPKQEKTKKQEWGRRAGHFKSSLRDYFFCLKQPTNKTISNKQCVRAFVSHSCLHGGFAGVAPSTAVWSSSQRHTDKSSCRCRCVPGLMTEETDWSTPEEKQRANLWTPPLPHTLATAGEAGYPNAEHYRH